MSDEPELFSERIAEFSAGWLDRDATATLCELIKAVKVTGQRGSLTLKLEVLPRAAKDGDIVIIKPVVTSKKPKLGVDPEVFRTYDTGEIEALPRDDDGLGDDDEKGNVTPIRKKR